MEHNPFQQFMESFNRELGQIVINKDAVTFIQSAPGDIEKEADIYRRQPLLMLYPPLVQKDDFFDTTHRVAGVIKRFFPEQSRELDLIISAIPEDEQRRTELASKMFTPGTNLVACFDRALPEDILSFLFSHTVKLLMKQYVAKAFPLRDVEQWRQGACPICGGMPSFAVLEKDSGKRSLYCGYCEITWPFQRLGCPFCYHSDSMYIYLEGIKEHRLYVCDNCQGYIKTIDLREFEDDDIDLNQEDAYTVHLDLLAVKEGYRK